MDRLALAIADSSWPLALSLALERWREARSPQLAELVDRIGARCGSPPPADADAQRWWIEHAQPYDPAMVTPLLDRVALRGRPSDGTWAAMRERWPDSAIVAALAQEPGLPQHRSWIERLVVMLAWPDDPRMARVLAGWLAGHEIYVRTPAFGVVYGAIADRLAALGDVRVVPRLAAFLEDAGAGFRDQRALVELVKDALEQRGPVPEDPELAELVAGLAPAGADLDRLWREVGDHPGDLGARIVLGDALVEAGDPRGELIALQIAMEAEPADPARDRRARRVKRLLDTWWSHWLGELAAIVVRDGTELRNGMLEVLRAGQPSTPPWAWAAVRGHRELRTVHTVRPFRVPPVEYARFVTGIEHLRTLGVDAPETLLELGRLGARLPIASLEYTPGSPRLDSPLPPVVETFRAFAPAAPELSHLALAPAPLGAELDALAAALPSLFPRLGAIELVAPSRVAARELAERFAGVPLVGVTDERR